MKYVQPYGIVDEDASYINGNPSTGTAGSIPPAASIEHPQREIVAAINSALKQDLSGPQFVPSAADLAQLVRAIQSTLLTTARDTGTANAYAANLTPAPVAYFEGMEITLKIANTNTSASVLNLNALGNKAIVNPDGSPVVANLLRAGAYVRLKYDGTNFQVVGSGLVAGAPVYLTAPKTLYVNASTGDDDYDGTSATFVSGVTGPFATLTRAATEIGKYNLNNFSITVNVADGVYTSGLNLPKYAGSGSVVWNGNTTTPANCIISVSGDKNAISGADCGEHEIKGFLLTAAGPSTTAACAGLFVNGATHINLGTIDWGFCDGTHMIVSRSAQVTLLQSAFNISGSSQGNSISPSAHAWVFAGGNLESNASSLPTMSTPIAVNIGTFVNCGMLGTTSYLFGTFNFPGNVTGKKYAAELNGIINTLGGGANYYPGTIAGTTATGGQYV